MTTGAFLFLHVIIDVTYARLVGVIMGCSLKGKSNPRYKHGLSKHPLHNLWRNIIARCNRHKDYKGRGIDVCDEWKEFLPFYKWAIANGWHEHNGHDLSIDRIDNDKGYSPDNCRWTDAKTQARNTRKCRPIHAVGEHGEVLHFKSTTFACDYLNRSHKNAAPNITACLKGRIKTAYGYRWFYDD